MLHRAMRTRLCTLLAAPLALLAGCDAGGATLSGDAFDFVSYSRIEQAEISVLELPDRRFTTGADGHFVFEHLPIGQDITLVLSHPDYHPLQTGTFVLGPAGAARVTFQAPTHVIFKAFALVLGITPDETNRCQMVTTVTRVGRSIYDKGAHGEAGAHVTSTPAPGGGAEGPVYFNASVQPQRDLTETSADGGVVYTQVPPGTYEWRADKPGVNFSTLKMKCRAGYLVNASPPWGLQAQ